MKYATGPRRSSEGEEDIVQRTRGGVSIKQGTASLPDKHKILDRLDDDTLGLRLRDNVLSGWELISHRKNEMK